MVHINREALLTDTTLAMIVRDAETNPMGGIRVCLENCLPYVERAFVVDTDSLDGTLDVLHSLQREYPHLEVDQIEFKGFDKARNHSLDCVETPYVLVLDADEFLLPKEYVQLQRAKEDFSDFLGYCVNCVDVLPDGSIRGKLGNNPRLFIVREDLRYYHDIYEYLVIGGQFILKDPKKVLEVDVTIKHFRASDDAYKKKSIHLYRPISREGRFIAPSSTPSYDEWNMPHPLSVLLEQGVVLPELCPV